MEHNWGGGGMSECVRVCVSAAEGKGVGFTKHSDRRGKCVYVCVCGGVFFFFDLQKSCMKGT